MDLPAIQLLCLEQEKLSLEVHYRVFIDLACRTNFPDSLLCILYFASMNAETKARLPGVGPGGNFATFEEWVLLNNDHHSPAPQTRPSGSALVNHRPACTFSSTWLHLPPGFAFVLGPTGSANVP